MSVRVRFAPSPTGGLHIGGLRTALFNYLFAKKNKGSFILRIEDTDQSRYVEGAEDYILESLRWCKILNNEGIGIGGKFEPYRQSERTEIYKEYAQQLVEKGHAYYAFDTQQELDEMRERLKEAGVVNLNYNSASRMSMNNSLTLTEEQVNQKINNGDPYVIRLKIPGKEEVRFYDEIRKYVVVHSSTLDDKVLIKSDGLPTYHLANVVDDYLMKISHVIRGEEWLPSAPIHVLLYKFLGWETQMPKFAHLPLILKADGNGKLSKRAADKGGFPIFPLSWRDNQTGEISIGYKETGFIPEALINFLAFLGWNPGTEKEIYSLSELIEDFSLERIGKAGTKFDYDKAVWFNQQYLKEKNATAIATAIIEKFPIFNLNQAIELAELFKPRVSFEKEILQQILKITERPTEYDEKVVRKKWNTETEEILHQFQQKLLKENEITSEKVAELFQKNAEENGFGPGKFMQQLRLSITGKASGPDLMKLIEILGQEECSIRIKNAIKTLQPVTE